MTARVPIGVLGVLCGLVIGLLSGVAFADATIHTETVQFNSAGTPPTAFELRRAKAKGITLETKPGIEIRGILHKPAGDGPFPAVVLIHSCFGIQPYQEDWARKLADWGYVALQVDSFGPRNIEETCSNLNDAFYLGVGSNNSADSYGALAYLKELPFIDGDNVALMGWGFSPIMSAVVTNGQQKFYPQKFKAAVAIYPYCKDMTSGEFYLPLAIHIGASDDWTFAKECDKTAAAAVGKANPVDYVKYPGAAHGYDDEGAGALHFIEHVQNIYSPAAKGASIGYDEDAARKTHEKVRLFLEANLD
ncbi:dienelactone hydrolase family protein [Aestuariispira insulae]|uniref:Dienelactone hydrolase n=1 Tax=Aestuariispira insulae TaxID=1461337 RepID=A0A3D9HHW2_9PROT|nr:dienelactone hydrolase family protein [Aestuariispira insulae]RED49060.1 dienelactone hydrolase [Aestuariispira insulae]